MRHALARLVAAYYAFAASPVGLMTAGVAVGSLLERSLGFGWNRPLAATIPATLLAVVALAGYYRFVAWAAAATATAAAGPVPGDPGFEQALADSMRARGAHFTGGPSPADHVDLLA